ncbi:hypothetical protein EDD85DRAFT_957944 [Armillaria nabsnona]|nr:hypothetical protein EDD85DRAFT_957944 [Armillaria nabsnona]
MTSTSQKAGTAHVTAGNSAKNCPKISDSALTHTLLKHFLTTVTNWRMTHHPTILETDIMPYLAPGFCDNQQLDDLYYQDVDRYNKLTPTQFMEIVCMRVYRTMWHLDMTGQNQLLDGNQEHLKDVQLIPLIKSRMNEDLREHCAEPELEMSKLYTLIVDSKADPTKDETMTCWAQLVELEDEKLRRERDKCQRETRAMLNKLNALPVAAPIQSFTPFPTMPQSFPNFSNSLYGTNIAAMSQPFQNFPNSQVQFTPRYNDLEKWAMFWLTHFCIQCRLPFQNHHKSDNVCEPCVALGYQICDIDFINRWVQAHPNGFENRCVLDSSIMPRKPHMITTNEVALAVSRQQAKGAIVPQYFINVAQSSTHSNVPNSQFSATSSSTAIPLGSSSHTQNVAPIQSIPLNYVAPILHKHSFPPSDHVTCPSSRNDCPSSRGDSRPSSRSRPPS